MKTRNKKGFTIVELVIVIAVIGILTAILVPVFINLTNKANEASDNSLVKNLNTALKMEEQNLGHQKSQTLQGAIDDLKNQGYLLENLQAKSGQDLLWNQEKNEFVLNDGKELDNPGNYWQIVKSIPSNPKYSYYAGANFTETDVEGFPYGFDAGENTGIESVTFNDNDGTKNVAIRTNSSHTTLSITAPAHTVRHYGIAGVVDITSIAPTSYHENGTASLAKIKNGRFVVTEKAEVAAIHVVATNNSYDGIKVAVIGNASLPSFTRDDVTLSNGDKKVVIEVQTLAEETTEPAADNTQYVWISKANDTVATDVATSKTTLDDTTKVPEASQSVTATAVKTEARESTSAADLEKLEEAAARYAGGIGTETKPYLIKTEQHINSLNEDVMDHLTDGVYYKLIDNLELANFKVIGSSIFTSYGPQSGEITGVDMFEGTLDGDNHYITYSTENITCSLHDGGVGFFSIIKGATIKNITFNATINTPNARNVGAVTGSIDGDDYHDVNTFQNITINGSVKGCLNAGGIAGVLAIGANVENCVNNASIILDTISTAGYTTMGGFFGQSVLCWDNCGNSLQNHVVTFTNCVNNGSIYVSASHEGAYYCGSNFIGFASDSYKGTYNFTNCSIGQNVTVNTSLPTSIIAGGKTIRTGYTTENYSQNSACMYVGITEKLTAGTTPLIALNINGTANDFSGYFVD